MKSAVVFGGQRASAGTTVGSAHPIARIDAARVRAGMIEMPAPSFHPKDSVNRRELLVRVRAFSCNYRDKSFIHRVQSFPAHRFCPVGSEYVGEVVEVGSEVSRFSVGERVLTNHHFTGNVMTSEGILEGVVTNRASRELQVVHESKLLRVPDSMDDVTAAAFSLNAQTAYSMVRKLRVEPGHHVLVTSATSNVALFLIPVLLGRGANVYVATTSYAFRERLLDLGVKEVIEVDRSIGFADNKDIVELAVGLGLFDRIFDPFFDLHLRRSVDLLRASGMYCTCGVLDQTPGSVQGSNVDASYGNEVFAKMMIRNLTLVGNCIGLTSDLVQALKDFDEGRYDVVVDSTYTGADFAGFLSRTFSAPDRFGKVVFVFS